MALHKIQDTSPVADGASLEAILTTDVGLEAVQRAIQASTIPSQKPTKAAIATALAAILTP